MKFTYIIFLICITYCIGAEDEGKRISSSYSYSLEYNDSDHGNFGHKIEVKDGAAKVNIRSENAKKYNSAVASKPGKPYLPQKKSVIYTKPKEEVAYVSAPESSTVVPVLKNNPSHFAPQVQTPKNAAVQSALQKYSQQQLAILLSQNKNPFLPIDPKDTINKFISQYISPQSGHTQSVPQIQSNTGYFPQVQGNNYLTQYQAQAPVSTDSKSQYPTTYYTPQQNNQLKQSYYQPQVQQSYQPASFPTHSPAVPQTQSVPSSQGPVKYVYVPQAPSQPTASYGTQQSGPVQFDQQSYQPVATKQQYVLNTAAYQSEQLTASYPGYSSANQQNAYVSSNASPVLSNDVQGKQQYVNSAYQANQATYNIPQGATQVTQPNYQNVYGSSLPSQYPSTVPSSSYGSSPNIATYKPVSDGATQFGQSNFDLSKYAQYVPATNQAPPNAAYKPSESSNAAQYFSGLSQTSGGNVDFSKYAQSQTSPAVAYKPSESGIPSASNAAHSFSGLPQASQTSGGNFDFSKYAQYIPASNQASPTVAHTSAGVQTSPEVAKYFSGIPQTSGNNFDFSKYAQYTPSPNQAASTVTYKPAEASVPSTSNAAQHLSAFPQNSGGNFDFNKYSQYTPVSNQASPAQTYKPAETGTQPSSNSAQYFSGLPSGAIGQDASKFGTNAGHNLFAGLQSSQNYGSLFSGATGVTPQSGLPFGNTYPQFGNSATSTGNYKPVVENPGSDTSSKLQYQSPNVNSILGSGNFDISKFQSPGLANTQNNYNVPSSHNFNLNQISNVQASDNNHGQYAIDIRQGTNPSGAAVMVQTNYNLGAQNAQQSYSSSPASAASDNSNVKYVYVPSYSPSAPSSPQGTNHGK